MTAARSTIRVMATPVLETKLHAPRVRHGLVDRRRLNDVMRRGAATKLTLVSAPPGFGKTTLVGDWLASRGPGTAAAWLSLDASDSDRATFLAYLVAALRSAVPGIGDLSVAALEATPPRFDVAIQAILNELAAVPEEVALVLDDLHVIDSPEVVDDLTFLLDHLPRTVHIVITTRADPPLPLSRMRARGELVEVRAADLRFTPEEAAAFLNESMDLALNLDDVAALEARTEGWVAGLQLAALSLRGRRDATSFIADFAGDDRYIVDYLGDEVLARQTEAVRGFLLDTAVLDRLTGPLCDAVTGRDDGGRMLEALDRANLFLVALDDRRHWYRYHHLFADVLRTRLLDERPDDVLTLHRRASEWFERHGEQPEAIRHALAGGDFGRAADWIELAHPALGRARGEVTLRGWLDALPYGLFEDRPVLAAAYAGVLMQMGEIDRVEPLLRAAERALAAIDSAVVVDRERLSHLPGQLAMYRAALSRIEGDLAATMTHARQALELADPRDPLGRGGPQALLGLATWETGDLDGAYRWFGDGMASLEQSGFIADVVGGAVTLADIRIAQGRLSDAMRIYERGLALATGQDGPPLRGAADMHVGISAVLRERNQLEAAAQHLAASRELGDENGLPKNPGRWRIAAARLRQAVGDVEGALQLLDEAQLHFFSDMSPDIQPIAALKARLWIAQGRLADARAWAGERSLAPDDELSYVREFEHATLARLMLAEAVRDAADETLGAVIDLTKRMEEAALAGGRYGPAIDILVVQALALRARGDLVAALATLKRSIALAEPEGYVRVFLDVGAPMTALLRDAAKREPSGSYVAMLRAASTTAPPSMSPAQQLVEPLSERELEILRLLATQLSGPEIASHLVVSLNTVRTHTRNVFAKLGVNSRRAAVHRAEELHLLTRSGH
jgi:LuxR family transcriptional regulator, maltose regulon positive regulatory protein